MQTERIMGKLLLTRRRKSMYLFQVFLKKVFHLQEEEEKKREENRRE